MAARRCQHCNGYGRYMRVISHLASYEVSFMAHMDQASYLSPDLRTEEVECDKCLGTGWVGLTSAHTFEARPTLRGQEMIPRLDIDVGNLEVRWNENAQAWVDILERVVNERISASSEIGLTAPRNGSPQDTRG